VYDAGVVESFLDGYASAAGEPLGAPVFVGVQVMTAESLRFGDVPARANEQLDAGRPGEEIAGEVLRAFVERGLRSIYLVPPIMRGGRRDYEAAARVIEGYRAG